MKAVLYTVGLIAALVVGLFAGLLGGMLLGSAPQAVASQACLQGGELVSSAQSDNSTAQAEFDRLKSDQLELAKQIIAGGRAAGASDFVIVTSLAIALQESELTNVLGGHGTSTGVFQMTTQSDNYWGTFAQRNDLNYSIPRHFREYERLENPESYSMFELAIEIQGPDRIAYASTWDTRHREAVARMIFSTFSDLSVVVTSAGAVNCSTLLLPAGNHLGQYPANGKALWGGYSNGRIPLDAMIDVDDNDYMRPDAAVVFLAMAQAAQTDGYTLSVTEAYRSYAGQVQCAADKGIAGRGGLCAVPGTSRHGVGTAVDLDTSAYNWLESNAGRFCFSTLTTISEPWHWQFDLTNCQLPAFLYQVNEETESPTEPQLPPELPTLEQGVR